MKNMKRIWLIAGAALMIALALFLLIPRSNVNLSYDNLIVNGDFSKVDDKGLPSSWYRDAYDGLTGAEFSVETDENGSCAHIVNIMPKDARFVQSVRVAPNSIYCLHGYIKASAQGGRGANLSVEGVYVFTDALFDTRGEWKEVSLYGRTGPEQEYVEVFVRLGGYSGESTGEAWFKDVTLCRVDTIPAGNYASDWYREKTQDAGENASQTQRTWSIRFVLSAIAYLVLFGVLFIFLRKRDDLRQKPSARSGIPGLILVLLCALGLRLALALWIPGYDVDISCFSLWGDHISAVGAANFYSQDYFCDYPPGYMLILWAVGSVGKLFDTGMTELMVKLPPILADLMLCALLYATAKKYKLSSKASLALVILYAFNPLVLITGAAWGQTDALMTMLLFLSVLWAVQGKWKAALPMYIVAVLFKPQALMFGPLGLIALAAHIVRNRKEPKKRAAVWKDLLLGLFFMVLAFAVIVVPFSIHQKWDWLINLYRNTMGYYAYATVNSCNIYFLLGKNWVGTDQKAGVIAPLLVYALAVTPLLAAGIGRAPALRGKFDDKKESLRFYLLAGISLALGIALLVLGKLDQLTYANLGIAMILYCVAVVGALYLFARDQQLLPVYGAVLLILLFNTGTMMHERYLFPAVALLVLGYILKKDTRLLWLAVGVAIAGLFNVGCALDRNIRIGGSAGHLDTPMAGIKSDTAVLEYFSAALNCALSFATLCLASVLSRGGVVSLSPEARPVSPLPQKTENRKMTGKDWAVLLIGTVAYAALAFTNLGSFKAPQTAIVSKSANEEITIDLGEVRDFKMAYYGGIHQYECDFTVQLSQDGVIWGQSYTAAMKQGDCFTWKYLSAYTGGALPVEIEARYVRIVSDHYYLTLHEVLFMDFTTGEVLPAQIVSDTLLASTADASGAQAAGRPITSTCRPASRAAFSSILPSFTVFIPSLLIRGLRPA